MEEKTINYKKDGEAWCATISDFVDLQESLCGFGKSKEEAYIHLLVNSLNMDTPDYCVFVVFPDMAVVYDVDDNGGGEALLSLESLDGRDLSSLEVFIEIKKQLELAKN